MDEEPELEEFTIEERLAALEQVVESLVVATMRKPPRGPADNSIDRRLETGDLIDA